MFRRNSLVIMSSELFVNAQRDVCQEITQNDTSSSWLILPNSDPSTIFNNQKSQNGYHFRLLRVLKKCLLTNRCFPSFLSSGFIAKELKIFHIRGKY